MKPANYNHETYIMKIFRRPIVVKQKLKPHKSLLLFSKQEVQFDEKLFRNIKKKCFVVVTFQTNFGYGRTECISQPPPPPRLHNHTFWPHPYTPVTHQSLLVIKYGHLGGQIFPQTYVCGFCVYPYQIEIYFKFLSCKV